MADTAELEKACVALSMQFENVGQAARDDAEKFLNAFSKRPTFVPDCLSIIKNGNVTPEIKKACGIYLDKKLLNTSNIREIPKDELEQVGKCLLEGLCDESVPGGVKTYLKSGLQSITYGQIEGILESFSKLRVEHLCPEDLGAYRNSQSFSCHRSSPRTVGNN